MLKNNGGKNNMNTQNNSDNDNPVLGFPEKLKKLLPVGFDDTVNSMNTDDVKKRLIEYEKAIEEFEKDMGNDVKLNSAKDLVKEQSSIYKVPIKEHRAMIKYLLFVMSERGE